MKKLVMLCCATIALCFSLLVLNLFRTNEINRINHIEDGLYTTKFFPSGSHHSSDELLEKLNELAQKYRVSFVKTEQSDIVTKAVVLYSETFPADNFGLETVTFSREQDVYASFKVKNQVGTIEIFLDAKPIQLLQMSEFFKDESRSINGSYAIVSTYEYDVAAIMEELSEFFGIEVSKLREQKTYSVVGYINQDLIISVVIIAIAFLILVLATIYQPLVEMKKIGVKKLLGYTNKAIFLEYISPNLLTLLIVSLLFDLSCLLFLSAFPRYFFMSLIWGQLIVLLLFLVLSVLVYTLLQQITVGKMLKGFLNFKLAIWLNYGLKLLLTIFIAVVLFFISNVMSDMQTQLEYQRHWKTEGGNYMTMETYKMSSELREKMMSAPEAYYNYFADLFEKLEKDVDAIYVRSERMDAAQRFDNTVFSELDVMYVNQNYLKSIHQFIPEKIEGKVFFVSEQLRNQEKQLRPILQQIYHQLLSYEEQEIKTYKELEVSIIYYEDNLEVFPYNEDIQENFKNPIFVLTSDEMLYEEKAYLTNTGVSNPMKVVNNQSSMEATKAILNQLTDGTEMKFSSLYAIQQSMVHSLEDGVKNFSFLVLILLVLNVIVSYFMVSILFVCQKQFIRVVRLLGWKLFDRYKTTFTVLASIYLLGFIFAILGGQVIVMLGQLLYILFDVLLVVIFLLRNEQKNLSKQLKEG